MAVAELNGSQSAGAVVEIAAARETPSVEDQSQFIDVLEGGGIARAKGLAFALATNEEKFLDPSISDGQSKNVSYDPATGHCGGTNLEGEARQELTQFLARYAAWSENLVRSFAPQWATGLTIGRTSFRPSEIEGRSYSLRKDDTRLHVDAFRTQPVQGRRILRVFANIDPQGRARVWQKGEPFPAFARRFLPRMRRGLPGTAWWLKRAGLTKGYRTAYDHTMLQLHDMAKYDDDYQRTAPRETVAFASGTTWFVYTDTVLHAALSGCHALEQTFLVDVEAMATPERSPLRVLETMTGRRLV